MMRRSIVREPVRLDILARDLLGTERAGMFEALIEANPGLGRDLYAAEGREIIAPDVERPRTPIVKTIDPWD